MSDFGCPVAANSFGLRHRTFPPRSGPAPAKPPSEHIALGSTIKRPLAIWPAADRAQNNSGLKLRSAPVQSSLGPAYACRIELDVVPLKEWDEALQGRHRIFLNPSFSSTFSPSIRSPSDTAC